MIASEARIAANRLNAQKSTGPKTPEGKERSRGNAVKHGMTGEGVALPSEDLARIERRFAGFEAVYRPKTEAGTALIRRAAMLSIRLERCAVQEAAAISLNIRAAESDFDEAREAEVDALFEKLEENPLVAVRRLLRMPEGVDRMVAAWGDLRDDLTIGSRWTAGHGAMALRLSGRKPGGLGVARVEALSRAIGGDFALLGAGDGAGLDPEGRRDWARRALAALIDEAVAKLEEHRETLDLEGLAADRARAADRALFDPSKAATLARKYEAAAERGMYRALKEMKAIEAEAAAQPDEPPAPALPSPPLASFSPASPSPATRPTPTPSAARTAPEIGSTYIPMSIGRAAPGRS